MYVYEKMKEGCFSTFCLLCVCDFEVLWCFLFFTDFLWGVCLEDIYTYISLVVYGKLSGVCELCVCVCVVFERVLIIFSCL